MFSTLWKPPADLYYSGNHWLANIELAGVAPEDIQLVVNNRQLTVRGQRKDLLVKQGYSCYSLEISYANFERSFLLPSPILVESLRTDYQKGILQIFFRTEAGGAP